MEEHEEEWDKMLSRARREPNVAVAEQLYERVLSRHPWAGKIWVEYAQREQEAGSMDKVESILKRTLTSCWSLEIWMFYLNFVARKGRTKERRSEEIVAAYEFAVKNIGFAPTSSQIWKDYLAVIENASDKGSEFGAVQNLNNLRRIYHRALALPLDGLEQLWNDYQNFEKSANSTTAAQTLSEVQKVYLNALQIQKERQQVSRGLVSDSSFLPRAFDGSANAIDQANRWKAFLAYEQRNPERVPQADLKQRVRYAYHQALVLLRFYAEIWYDFAIFEKDTGDDDACETVLKAGLTALADSTMLHFALAEFYEGNSRFDDAREVFEGLLSDQPAPIVFIMYQRFSRRVFGIDAARTVFRRARLLIRTKKDSQDQDYAPVFVAAALLEFSSNGNFNAAKAIFELAMKTFPENITIVLEFTNLLSHTARENDALIREVFERAITNVPPKQAFPVWVAYRDFETNLASFDHSSLGLVQQIQQRMANAYPDHPELRGSVAAFSRYRFLDSTVVSDQSTSDKGFLQRNASSISAMNLFSSTSNGSGARDRRSTSRSRGGEETGSGNLPGAGKDAVPIPPFLEDLVSLLPSKMTGLAPDANYVMRIIQNTRLAPRPASMIGGEHRRANITGGKRKLDDAGTKNAPTDILKQRQISKSARRV